MPVVPGATVYIRHHFERDGLARWKMFVVVAVDGAYALCFIVNSAVSDYVRKRPHLAKCQLMLRPSPAHRFLDVESALDCSTVHRLPLSDLETAVIGRIELIIHPEVAAHARKSVGIAPADLRLIERAIDSVPI